MVRMPSAETLGHAPRLSVPTLSHPGDLEEDAAAFSFGLARALLALGFSNHSSSSLSRSSISQTLRLVSARLGRAFLLGGIRP